jgi:surfeit locus 1 family protein
MTPAETEPDTPDTKKKARTVPLAQMPRTLINRRWWWTTLLVIVGVIVLARLGLWQLDRLDQRRARNAAYLEQIEAEPITLADELLRTDPAGLKDRPARAKGQFDLDHQLIITQQNYKGQPGAYLVTPFRITGAQAAVLVNRGWIPAEVAASNDLAQFERPGEQMINGSIQLSESLSGGRQTQAQSLQDTWYRIDVEAIGRYLPYPILPFYLLEKPTGEVPPPLPYRLEPDIDLSEGPHLSYAIQWFLFATILAVGYFRYVSTHNNR